MVRKGKKKKGRVKVSKNTDTIVMRSNTKTAKEEVEHLIDGISLAIKSSSLLKSNRSLSSFSQSDLFECLKPIQQALERIDAQRLLDLDLISSPHNQQETVGPRLKDG